MKTPFFFIIAALALSANLSAQEPNTGAPVLQQAYEIDGARYDASGVEAIRRAMSVDSAALLGRMRLDLTREIVTMADTRRGNTDPFLDWYYGYLNNYAKMFKTVAGSIEDYEEENFDRIINTGVDAESFYRKIRGYQEEAAGLANSYIARLRQNALDSGSPVHPVHPVQLKGTLDARQFFAPFAVLRVIEDLLSALGIENTGFLTDDSSILSRGFASAGLALPVVFAPQPVKDAAGKIFKGVAKRLKDLVGWIFGKAAVSMGAKAAIGAAGKTAAKAGTGLAAKAAMGAAGGAIGGPIGIAVGVAGAVAADLVLDWVFNKGDEVLHRNGMKAAIEAAINEERDFQLAALGL